MPAIEIVVGVHAVPLLSLLCRAGTKLARRSPSSEEPAHPIRVGCAGWSISAAQRAQFDEGSSGLARYASRLACLEINSSFHRSHRPDTYARWAATVPVGFRFSVKLPRTISHEQRLRGTGPLLDRFLDESSGLGEKLGCMLLQLPPSLALEPRTAARFFAMLRRRWSGNVACEPRHASWFGERAEDMFQITDGGDQPLDDTQQQDLRAALLACLEGNRS